MATRALLDTHSFLRFIGGNERLSRRARALIESRDNPMFVSAGSLWEVAIKHGLGKLALDRPFAELIAVLGVELAHLAEFVRLPLHHRDPFDRLIVAQARVESLPVISVDRAFDAYGVERIW
jgi:PIN domain nuclease of toxin-antitoxin system